MCMLNDVGTRSGSLSGRMQIAVCSADSGEFSDRHVRFYAKYAAVTLKVLEDARFQRFLDWIMRRENIEERRVASVQVGMYPYRMENGNGLAGKFSSKGEIFIYPRRLEFCRRLVRDFEKEMVYFYIKARAKATLIHELLHAKYSNDEAKVRRLTRKYFTIFARHQNAPDASESRIIDLIFLQ